jgi:hypothetical protein
VFIAVRKKLVDADNRLAGEGKVVKPNDLIMDEPYVELKEAVGGYIVVSSDKWMKRLKFLKAFRYLQSEIMSSIA